MIRWILIISNILFAIMNFVMICKYEHWSSFAVFILNTACAIYLYLETE